MAFRHEVLSDPYQVSALKGFLAPHSLVHPENPLRQEGHDGLELWMGEVESVTRFSKYELLTYHVNQELSPMESLVLCFLPPKSNIFDTT